LGQCLCGFGKEDGIWFLILELNKLKKRLERWQQTTQTHGHPKEEYACCIAPLAAS
ncbi:hypothetical protein ACJX0J_027485, partial [Zea mays]